MNKNQVRLWLAAASVLAARFYLIFRYRFDSDEPQHMHVAWGWAHGLMQYRDVFDNHMPLFHMLSAPLFAIGGDNPRLLFAARMLMVPMFCACIGLVWFIARAIFDDRTALIAAGLAALTPPFFLGSLEYRTDDLWIVCWLAALAIIVSNLTPRQRSVFGGFAVGVAFGISMKTTLLTIAISSAAVITALLMRNRGAMRAPRALAAWVMTFVACVAAVPATIFAGFALAGAWVPFHYGVFAHNVFPYEHAYRLLFFIPLYPIVRNTALFISRMEGDDLTIRRRLFIFLAGAMYFSVLVSFWPMTSMESYLPFFPIAAIFIAPLLRPRPALVQAAVAASLIIAIFVTARPWRNDAREEIAMIDEVLALTSPGEPVMDMKGETVFRHRPWYFALEAITNIKLRIGQIRDDIADHLVNSQTHVVVADKTLPTFTASLPPRARKFVDDYYVPWGAVRVAGVRLRDVQPARFRLGVGGRYIVIDPHGRVIPARIDHRDATGGVNLAPGDHEIDSPHPLGEATVIWSGVLRART